MKPEQPIGRLIKFIAIQGRKYFERELATFGLSGGTHVFLVVLYKQDGINQNSLTHKLHFDKANTARMIKKLEELDYVVRKQDEHDARANCIFLTDKAKSIKDEIFAVFNNWTETLLEGFDNDEKNQALDFIERIAVNAEKKCC